MRRKRPQRGDEFVVIIEGEDYKNRETLLTQLETLSQSNAETEDGIVIAAGMASRRKSETFVDVFRRADDRMYVHKGKLKEIRPSHVLR